MLELLMVLTQVALVTQAVLAKLGLAKAVQEKEQLVKALVKTVKEKAKVVKVLALALAVLVCSLLMSHQEKQLLLS